MPELTNKGEELVKRWRAAEKQVSSCREKLLEAQRELQSAEEYLAMWLLPEDAKEGEQFCVWYGDSLIAAKELPEGDERGNYEVTTRKRGKSLMV